MKTNKINMDELVKNTKKTHRKTIASAIFYTVAAPLTVVATVLNVKNTTNKYTGTSVACFGTLVAWDQIESAVKLFKQTKETKKNYEEAVQLRAAHEDLQQILHNVTPATAEDASELHQM